MKLEELIYKRLAGYEPLTDRLSRYGDLPAVFYQKAPDDTDLGWSLGPQYPRAVADLNLQANSERKSAGTLTVSIYCDTAGTEPELIVPYTIAALRDVLLKTDDDMPYAFAWSRSDPFELQLSENTARRVIGQDVYFDVLELPSQETTDPDPIEALNIWLKDNFQDAVVIGRSDMDEITEASVDKPVIYTQFLGSSIDYETFAFSWIISKLAVHVICPDSGTRLKLAMAINYGLVAHDEVMMLDGSSMRARNVSFDNRSDYLVNGQISVDVRYSIINHRIKASTLRHANIELRERSN